MMARKQFGQDLLLLMTAMTALSSHAAADSFTITDGEVVNTTQFLDTPGDVGIVERGGTIDAPVSGITLTADDVTVLNAGTVSGTVAGFSNSASGISGLATRGTIINSGTAQAFASGTISWAGGISVNADGALDIDNTGLAFAQASGEGAMSYGIVGGQGSNIVNRGEARGVSTGYGSSATAIGVVGERTVAQGAVTNSGSALAMATGEQAMANGIGLTDFTTVMNTGLIGASATGESATALGILGGRNNHITNLGIISAQADGYSSVAAGILTPEASVVVNSGLALGSVEGADSSAWGINVGFYSIVKNSGSIQASSMGQGSQATGVQESEGGLIRNSGAIVATSLGDMSRAQGILATNAGIIDNAGSINAEAVGYDAYAYGMRLQDAPNPDDPGNVISNSGTIRAHADGANAVAFGIQGYIGNSLNNSGIIEVESTGINSKATGFFGWFDDTSPEDRIVNSGRVRVVSSGSHSKSIAFDTPYMTPLLNSGLIESTATGDAAEAIGAYIHVGDSDIDNSGTIRSTAVGDSARAYGIYLSFPTQAVDSVTNTGTISASATGEGAESYGVLSATDDTITNCGTIAGGTAAVKFAGSDNSLNLCKGSHIEGALLLGEGNAFNVDLGRGANAALHFEGSPTVTVTGGPHVVVQNTVAVVDPTGFSAEDDMLNDLTRVIADSVDGRLAAARARRAPGAVALNGALVTPAADAPPGASEGITFWASAIGQTRDQDGSGPYVGFESRLGGAVFGADGVLSPELRAGAFIGASASSLETNSNSETIDADSYFGGIYAGLQKGAPFLNLAFTAGLSDQNSNRTLNDNLASGGTSHAKADYSGGFISPQATLGADIAMPGAVFTPSVRARYSALFLNDYDEHGSTADLSVDGRTVQVFDLRGQLAFSVPVALEAGELSLTTRLGGDATFASDSTVNTQLLGETLDIDINGQDTVDGFAGFDIAYTTRSGMRFFATTEFGLAEDASTTNQATAGFELRL